MFCHQSNKIKSLLSSFLVYFQRKFYCVHHYLNLYAKWKTVCSIIQINKNISSWYLYHTQLVFIINNKSVHIHLQIKYFSQKYIFCKEIFAIFQLSASPYHLLVHHQPPWCIWCCFLNWQIAQNQNSFLLCANLVQCSKLQNCHWQYLQNRSHHHMNLELWCQMRNWSLWLNVHA